MESTQGTDYAAPRGTPITTTASGTVIRTGYTRKRQVWSNTITPIQLNTTCQNLGSTWSTCKSRDVIGRVGSTGLATGPHVCYRFGKMGGKLMH
jgi:murein DD-endopeptidase MepM/ murein hydrolase activator NlpD